MTTPHRPLLAALVLAASWLFGFVGLLLRYDFEVDFSVSTVDIESALDVGLHA